MSLDLDRNLDDWVRDMWYCPDCEHWVGRAREECSCGRERPRLPLFHEDVEFDNSRRVTRWDRLRAKIRRVLEAVRI